MLSGAPPARQRNGEESISGGSSGGQGFPLLSILSLSGCTSGVLDPRGPVGESEKLILYDSTVLMLTVVVPVILGTLAVAWWFRSGNSAAIRRPQWDYSGRIEFVTWSIPALMVMFLSGIAWIGSHELDPPRPLTAKTATVEIEVVSLAWTWLFIYPQEHVASVNQLIIPVNIPVRFRLTSSSVMNSFFIPQLGSQIYTMAGMTTQLNLQASAPGRYEGISAQFSGAGFSDMRFAVRAVSLEDYQNWLASSRVVAATLDESRFKQLARPSVGNPPSVYGSVTATLFDAIVQGHGFPSWQDPSINQRPK
jgi:cytochrome o ubiquinol oxidase subunit II